MVTVVVAGERTQHGRAQRSEPRREPEPGAHHRRRLAQPADRVSRRSKDLRPTPDRVRETLFNWLGQDLTGQACLDLFAGSGALGFEAASRGARRVVMVERDPRGLPRARGEPRRARGGRGGARRERMRWNFCARDGGVYDVVFLDPPFAAGYWPRLAPLLPPRLAPAGAWSIMRARAGRETGARLGGTRSRAGRGRSPINC